MRYTGIVQRGEQKATAFGFPTINIPLDDASVSGVYAAKVKAGEEDYNAVAYADRKRKRLEAHLFDFSADLYGWNVSIELMHKLRDEKKFKNDEEARAVIEKDIAAGRRFFERK